VSSTRVFFACCRAFQGIGPAFALQNAIRILGWAYQPGLKKQMVFSAFGATAPSGYVVGATFSSLLAERVWWPWAYWVNTIACLLIAAGTVLVVPHTPSPDLDNSENSFRRVNGLGALTGVSGVLLFNFA
jgi:hypothetical protein